MKKTLIITFLVVLLGIVFGLALIPADSATFQARELAGKTLEIDSTGLSKITIREGSGDQIEVNLTGPKEKTEKIRFFRTRQGEDYRVLFEQIEDWGPTGSEIEGEISIPRGTNIDLTVKDGSDIEIEGHSGDLKITGSGGYNIRSGNSNHSNLIITAGGNGNINLDNVTGDASINNTGDTDITIDDADIDDLIINNEGDGDIIIEDGNVGSENTNNSGDGDVDFPPLIPSNHPCSVGTSEEQVTCCEAQGQEQPSCVGEWDFNSITDSCVFDCFTEEELQELQGNTDDNPDQTSITCSLENTPDLQSECCNEALKNELSIGPRPGFPDCIGKWYYNGKDERCDFKCASHGERLKIIKELQQQNQ